jgi:competence protein ComEA
MRALGLLLVTALFPAAAYAASVNINTANAQLLDTLPGIGPAKAAAIIEYRTANGPFKTIADIQNVSGIGPATYANLKDLITVGGSASVSQPIRATQSYNSVKEVDPINSPESTSHEEASIAPAEVTQTTAVGAALAAPIDTPNRAAGLLSSWTLGLLGIILIAGGAFIFI